MTHLVMIRHDLGLTFLFVGFARDFMVFMTEISFGISFFQPKCLSTNISMSAVIIILNKVIYIRTYLKPLEIINFWTWSSVVIRGPESGPSELQRVHSDRGTSRKSSNPMVDTDPRNFQIVGSPDR